MYKKKKKKMPWYNMITLSQTIFEKEDDFFNLHKSTLQLAELGGKLASCLNSKSKRK
jgi:hypothetical protein